MYKDLYDFTCYITLNAVKRNIFSFTCSKTCKYIFSSFWGKKLMRHELMKIKTNNLKEKCPLVTYNSNNN